ncbi:hypothetical protein E2C01_093385 [Portunus trituberculatus]|uniref:Uncharacterized protein n=1 Tax=Portunus trituberculatus TaxID=210409 RepID=A0A5B7JTV3_PORTR|nr:hypothetical protein [Portunus trituberculatus]
MTSLCTAKR